MLKSHRSQRTGWLGDQNVALPDLNTESQTVIDYFNTWVKGLVSNYSIDALRIDTFKHVRKDFWPAFISSGGVFAVGEVLNGGMCAVSPTAGPWLTGHAVE